MRLHQKTKIEVFVSDASKKQIREKSKQLGTSMAEIMKRALELYFHEN